MEFKHPEILYFLFLLVIPILVHLFQLRRFKKEYFTNVQFLKALSVQTRKSSQIKKWLLLATRLLLLAALIFAFAQPFFKATDIKSTNNELFVVLDNSFSMQAKGQKGELFKRAIEDLLAHTPENQIFSLVTNSQVFWNTDINSIKKELQNLKYSPYPFELDNLMAKIKGQKSNENKDVVIITDAIGIKPKQLNSINPEFNTYFIVPESEQKINVSLDSVFIKETTDKFYEIGIKISNSGTIENSIPIAIYNDKKLIAKTLIQFKNKKKEVNFTIPKEDFNGYVSIVDNSLEYDNALYFSISTPKKTNIISIGQAEKNIFLSKICTNSDFNFSAVELANLDYNILDQQDAIVLNELKEIPQALQTTLKSFMKNGGNVVLIPSPDSNISNLNSFVANFGNIQFNTLQNKEKLITKIVFNHPLFEGVFDKKVTNFQYPNMLKSFLVTTTSSSILNFEDQNVFLTSISNPLSNFYVFSAPINKENSNFQNSPLIVPVFYNMIKSSKKSGILAYKIGGNESFIADIEVNKDEIISLKNDQESFIPLQQILNNKVKLTFGDYPEQAGNFGIFKQNELFTGIGFNYNRSEGDVSNSNENLLTNFKKIDSIETVFDTIQTDRTNSEIWKWFAILTLIFLIIEILIQKFVK